MSKKTLAGISAAAILSILAGNAYAAATADENGITPLQWYKFDGNMTQMGSGSTGWADNGSNYIDALDGKAMSFNGSVSPYTGSFATGDGSWTIVTMAKGAATANPSIIFSNGQQSNSGFALATSNAEENNVIIRVWGGTGTLSGYEAAEGNYTDIITATVADVTAFHLYALSYDSEAHTLTLKIDGTAAGSLSGITYTHRGEAQLGGIHGGSTAGLSRTTGVSMDDFRVYGQVLTDAQLSQVAATFAGGFTTDFSYRAIAGQVPTGWFSSWQWNGFDGSRTLLGPTADSIIYMTSDSGNNNRPGTELSAKDKRTFAVYANLELMKVSANTTHTLLGVGGSISGCKSVNLVRIGNEVKLGYINNYQHVAYSEGIDVTGLKGWHLFVFSYDSEVGTSLSMDGGTPVTDTSDNAKFVPTAGMQIGVTWQGGVYGRADNAAIAQVLGYDAVLTEAQIAKAVQNYPAVSTLSTDFNYSVENGSITIPSLTVNAEKYIGVTQGTINIPAGVEVSAERVRTLNSGSETTATMNLAGKITISKESDNSNVWSGGTGVLFGHWRGTGTYNITGELDASKAYIELRYSAGDQVFNLDGGTMKAKGIYYVNANGATGDVKVNASNGATIETTSSTGFVAPLEVTEGDVTIKTTESYTNGKAITVTGGNLIFDVAEGKTLTLTGEITGEGTITKKGAGTLVVPNTDVVIKYEAGTITLPDGFTGTVDLSGKTWTNATAPASFGKTGSTVKLPAFTGWIDKPETIDTTLELTGDVTLSGGYSPWTTAIKAVKGTGKFSVTASLNNSYQIKIGEVSGDVTFGVAAKNVIILPSSYTGTVDGAVAKVEKADGVHYCARIDEALSGITAETISSVTVLGTATLPESWSAYTVDENGKIVLAKTAAELFLEGVAAGGEVALTDSITVGEWIVVDKAVTIDLAGHTITAAETFTGDAIIAIKHGGALTLKDSATGGTVDGSAVMCGIKMTQNASDTDTMAGDAVLVMQGGTVIGQNYGISGNGKRGGTSVTIEGGTVKAITEGDGVGIYQPQAGTLTITGGTVQGTTFGVYAKSGTLAISGGTIKSTATSIVDPSVNNNGTNGKGYALVLEKLAPGEGGYADNLTCDITGGTFEGVTAILSWARTSSIRLTKFVADEVVLIEGEQTPSAADIKKSYKEGPTSWEDVEDVTTVIELPEGTETKVTTDELAAWASANEVEFTAGITIDPEVLILNCAPSQAAIAEAKDAVVVDEKTMDAIMAAVAAGTDPTNVTIPDEVKAKYPMAKIELVESTKIQSTETAKFFQLKLTLK